MKIFQTVREKYEIVGISSPLNETNRKFPFNERTLLGFPTFVWATVAQFVYIFHVADGFLECMEGICTTSAGIIMFVSFATIVHRKSTLFECIRNIETLIDTSKPISICRR